MSFAKDIQQVRDRARQKIEQGPVTGNYGLDPQQVIGLLNDALCTEIMCVLRYRFHYFMATGIHSAGIAAEFLEHANEEQQHADQLARRVKQLGGKPEMNPVEIARRSHSEYREGSSLAEMLREDLIAERIAIETYRDMVGFFGDKDPTSRVLLESILAKEEEHADEIADLLFEVGAPRGEGSAEPHSRKQADSTKRHRADR